MSESETSKPENIIKPSTLQPPIIMKIDGPAEEQDKDPIEDNEKNNCLANKKEEFKMCSPLFSNTSRSTTNPFATAQSKSNSKSILKMPQLNVNSSSSSSKPFALKPSQLSSMTSKLNSDKSNNEKIGNGDKQTNQVNGDGPKFVPLVVEAKTKPVASQPSASNPKKPTMASSSFVFGENLQARAVAGEGKTTDAPSTSTTANGTSEMLFSSVVKKDVKPDSTSKDKEGKTLSESAREYEESRSNKRKYEEVEVFTGEENERNILNISCKLFSFDNVTSNWQERGRGTLRLNDFDVDSEIGSRIVFRTSGCLRVILNTKIWAEMTVDKASEKSIRLTALDGNGDIKVFLVMASNDDAGKLFHNLQTRLEREINAQKRKKGENMEENEAEEN
ncbi:unnamed protein product [Acanthoscelides obtectus]|uniref:RanBD1 domain-containing protein n=1 Tax=Acanthoscelides obtectus TaxID=200917 RepID=A0A9P0P958_ACAOB|nr:unnamed protein product [Acanthoscelides obtectus]CAK1657599.1 Ran-binding protein 3 [Acanthoscelides obtectus]